MADAPRGMLDLEALERGVDDGSIETVVTALPDPYGRLIGKRITGRFFLDHIAGHGMQRTVAPLRREAVDRIRVAEADGLGVVSLGSKMIDPPVVKQALRLVDQARQLGLVPEDRASEDSDG